MLAVQYAKFCRHVLPLKTWFENKTCCQRPNATSSPRASAHPEYWTSLCMTCPTPAKLQSSKVCSDQANHTAATSSFSQAVDTAVTRPAIPMQADSHSMMLLLHSCCGILPIINQLPVKTRSRLDSRSSNPQSYPHASLSACICKHATLRGSPKYRIAISSSACRWKCGP